MSRYEVLLFVHVLAASAWFGAALFSLALLEFAGRARDSGTVLALGRYDDPLANALFIPAGLVTLGAGVVLVLDSPWSFLEDGWVLAGLVLFAAIFVLGIALIVPAGKKLKELAAAGEPAAEVEAQIGRLRMLSRVDVALLALAIFFMTAKPF